MADSQQIQAIQTKLETMAINNNSRNLRKRKSPSPASSSSPRIPGSPAAATGEIHAVATVNKRTKYRGVNTRYEMGFRFIPTDEELIQDYLMKKLEGQPIMLEGIHEVDLYQFNPEDLAENHPHLGELKWYFFTRREWKYRNGLRSAGNGYWKATGADKKITLDKDTPNERIIGYRKALMFYQGYPPNGKQTNWILHEYIPLDDMKLDDVVLCKMYEKPEQQEKKRLKDETSDGYEDQDMDVPTSTSTSEIGDEDEDEDDALGTSPPGHATGHAAANNNPNGDATYFIYPSEDSIMPWALEEPPSLFYDEGMKTQLERSPYSSCYDHLQLFLSL